MSAEDWCNWICIHNFCPSTNSHYLLHCVVYQLVVNNLPILRNVFHFFQLSSNLFFSWIFCIYFILFHNFLLFLQFFILFFPVRTICTYTTTSYNNIAPSSSPTEQSCPFFVNAVSTRPYVCAESSCTTVDSWDLYTDRKTSPKCQEKKSQSEWGREKS